MKLMTNIIESTHSPNILRNLFFLLTKKFMTTVIEHVFSREFEYDPTKLLVKTKAFNYEEISWEICKAKGKIEQLFKNTSQQ